MGDRPAERSGLGPLDVDVDPLVVAGGLGELVDLLLGDLHVVAVAEVLADERAQLVDAVDRACSHVRQHVSTARACYECRPMPDILTAYAQLQPDKLAVVDDRLGGDVRTRHLRRARGPHEPLAHVLLGHGVGPGVEGRVVRAELDGRRRRSSTRPASSARPRCR